MIPVDSVASSINPINFRPTYLEVDLDAISDNVAAIRKVAPRSKFMAILKANAYGHGLAVCGKHFEACGADYLGVAFLEEGILLRQAGVRCPILVLGGIFNDQLKFFFDYNLEIIASSISKLEAIEETAKRCGMRAKIHLKIDTGMERIGVHYYSAEGLLQKAIAMKHCDIVGISSHFANAHIENLAPTRLQLERYLEVVSFFDKHSLPTPIRHIANSASMLTLPEAHLDMVRPGIISYGVYPAEHTRDKIAVRPAARLRSQVVFFKVVKKGAGVSYSHIWTAPRDTRVVTVPVGYGDGYFRGLSEKASVIIKGKRYPVIGRICMDQIMVDIGQDEAYVGDEVVLLGGQGAERIDANEIADWASTNSHEVLVAMSLRLPRRYKQGSESFFES